jgi:structural hemagglutinin/hemolysin toxin protein RtxA
MTFYNFYYYVPKSHLESTKTAIFKAGAGIINNYSCCSWETKGEGQFYPEKNSNPYVGTKEKITKVSEYKVETICHKKNLVKIINALKKAHPYEEPAYGAVKLELPITTSPSKSIDAGVRVGKKSVKTLPGKKY